jgi:prophage endopeptidase
MKEALIGILICVGLYAYGHHKGWNDRDAEMQSEIAAKNEEARTKEQELNQKLNDNANKLQEANNAISEKQSALDRAIRAGRVRLPSSSCVQASASSTPTGGNQQAGTDADAETLRLIAQIAADGDKAINQLNACIDAYEQVRSTINGQR